MIAIFSVIVSIIALAANINTNKRNQEQYLESLKPLLSFSLYNKNNTLLLSIKNLGKSEALNVNIKIINVENVKNEFICIDNLFNNTFELFPKEEIQGQIAYFFDINSIPSIVSEISYKQGIDNKSINYNRKISFRREIFAQNTLNNIENELTSIAYSNNRVANYLDRERLQKYDEMNIVSKNSLHNDLKEALNNHKNEKKGEKI